MDKAEKKRLQQESHEKEKQAFIESLPMSVEFFSELFDRLREKSVIQSCNNTLELTLEFLEHKGVSTGNVIEWLKNHGGYCDCEVLMNVEDNFMILKGLGRV